MASLAYAGSYCLPSWVASLLCISVLCIVATCGSHAFYAMLLLYIVFALRKVALA
jgi:hypothetical protein